MAGDDSCTTRVLHSTATGAAAGGIAGAILSNWGDVPVMLRNQAWPALKRTGAPCGCDATQNDAWCCSMPHSAAILANARHTSSLRLLKRCLCTYRRPKVESTSLYHNLQAA